MLDPRTQTGARFRLSPPRLATGRADDAALAAFAQRVRDRAAAAGHPLAPAGEALGEMESTSGLTLRLLVGAGWLLARSLGRRRRLRQTAHGGA